MSVVSTVGIDLAKNVFSVHGVQTGRTIVFATRLQSRAIESFDLPAIGG